MHSTAKKDVTPVRRFIAGHGEKKPALQLDHGHSKYSRSHQACY